MLDVEAIHPGFHQSQLFIQAGLERRNMVQLGDYGKLIRFV
jgi:hypothetical protein